MPSGGTEQTICAGCLVQLISATEASASWASKSCLERLERRIVQVISSVSAEDSLRKLALDVDVRSLPSLSAASHVAIWDDEPGVVNTLSPPDRVVPKTPGDPELGGRGGLQAVLPPVSWNMIWLS